MNRLLTLSALMEAPVGLALMMVPAEVVRLLLGGGNSGAAIPLGRVLGAALLALSLACWSARYDTTRRAARGMAGAMLLYNLGAVLVLGAAGIQSQPVSLALWPAVILHGAMGVWCVVQLANRKTRTSPEQ